jgi:toxin secretion/phage lysis holin
LFLCTATDYANSWLQIEGSLGRTAIVFFYLSNEGISLLENSAHLGLPIPEKLKDVLEQLHNKSDEEE